MITAVLITIAGESKILKFNTDCEDEACKLLVEDWKNGKIIWDYPDTNIAFSKEWLEKYGLEPLSDYYDKQFDNGVRYVAWHYCGDKESDDDIVSCYFIHSKKNWKSELILKPEMLN